MYHYVPDDYLKIYRQANPPLLPEILGTAPSVGHIPYNVNNTVSITNGVKIKCPTVTSATLVQTAYSVSLQ